MSCLTPGFVIVTFCAISMVTAVTVADQKVPTTSFSAIWDTRRRCLERADENTVVFRKVDAPETLWSVEFGKDGVTIAMEKSGQFLCVDPKSEKLRLCKARG